MVAGYAAPVGSKPGVVGSVTVPVTEQGQVKVVKASRGLLQEHEPAASMVHIRNRG